MYIYVICLLSYIFTVYYSISIDIQHCQHIQYNTVLQSFLCNLCKVLTIFFNKKILKVNVLRWKKDKINSNA